MKDLDPKQYRSVELFPENQKILAENFSGLKGQLEKSESHLEDSRILMKEILLRLDKLERAQEEDRARISELITIASESWDRISELTTTISESSVEISESSDRISELTTTISELTASIASAKLKSNKITEELKSKNKELDRELRIIQGERKSFSKTQLNVRYELLSNKLKEMEAGIEELKSESAYCKIFRHKVGFVQVPTWRR